MLSFIGYDGGQPVCLCSVDAVKLHPGEKRLASHDILIFSLIYFYLLNVKSSILFQHGATSVLLVFDSKNFQKD